MVKWVTIIAFSHGLLVVVVSWGGGSVVDGWGSGNGLNDGWGSSVIDGWSSGVVDGWSSGNSLNDSWGGSNGLDNGWGSGNLNGQWLTVDNSVETVDWVGGVVDGSLVSISIDQGVLTLDNISVTAFVLGLGVSGEGVLDVV
jgi:hypothetical protein